MLSSAFARSKHFWALQSPAAAQDSILLHDVLIVSLITSAQAGQWVPAHTGSTNAWPGCCFPYHRQQVYQEVELHLELDVDWVVPFWAAVDEGQQLHIVLQYCPQHDLRTSLRASGPLCEAYVRDQVVLPLLQALRELHAKVG